MLAEAVGPPDDAPPFGPDGLRVPPHSLEAEQTVLGCLLVDNTVMSRVADLLDQRSFYRHEHRVIYGAIAGVLKAGNPADVITVHAVLASQGVADEVGGLVYLNDLAKSVPGGFNARRYAEIVAEHYAERALIAAADEVASISWETGTSLADRADRISAVLVRAQQMRDGVGARVPVLGLEALRKSFEQVRWSVKHVIPAASVGMLFGGSGTFKSFIAVDAALHIAHGLPWMGRLTRQGPVLYIAAEGGAGLWGRINAWHRERRLEWAGVPFYVVPTAVDLTVDAWRVVDAAQGLGVTPAMVVVDTLSQTYTGEENNAGEMAAYLREIGLRFRELWRCSVLLVHHTGHQATERPRGSSAIRANLDFLLGVYRDEKEMLATMNCVKQKDGELFGDASFQLSVIDLGVDDDGDKLTSLVARHLSSKEEVERARIAEQAAGRGGRNSAFMALVQSGMDLRSLRKEYYELLEGLDSEAKKKAFARAKQWAVAQGFIDVAAGIVIDLRKGGD